jgi:restriction system protein
VGRSSKSLLNSLVKISREAEKQRKAQIRKQTQAAKAAERAQKEYLRAQAQELKQAEKEQQELMRMKTQSAKATEIAQKEYLRAQTQKLKQAEKDRIAQAKEKAQLYTESRITYVDLQNEQLEEQVKQLENLLTHTLSTDDFLDLDKLKQTPNIPVYTPLKFDDTPVKPAIEKYLPPEPSGIKALIPGNKQKFKQEVETAIERYQKDSEVYNKKMKIQGHLATEHKAKYDDKIAELRKQAESQNAEIEDFKRDFAAGLPEALVKYFTLVLEASSYPEDFPQEAKIAYVPESKQLVIEYDLPSFEIIPEVSTYKYVKTKDEITTSTRPAAQRKNLYSSVVAQVTIRTLHELFEADRTGHLETIIFNGYVDSIDRGTGRPIRTCLVTVRTTRETFVALDLSKVDPIACLKVLSASFSKSPAELAPVRPVLEFNMVDPRFVEETDVLSSLDQGPNLMELTPSEFESLITNLFEKMGLETRLTQASRDGGVDCVAYDPRPIFGGKVIIQAKRYKHTVGVSAVRDLFGTLQNEGASKGILVTTSGYGKAAFEFANNKPLELLDGSNLLYLLSEHAGIEAKIEPPENWKDPEPDSKPEAD